MRQDWYEVLVLAARYWFVLLGVIVVWRGFGWLRMEARQRKRKLRQLPDAGFIGAFYVIAGESRAMRLGDALPVPMEGTIGSASGCDIQVQHPDVAGRHALFEFRSEGLRLRPFRDEPLCVDDQLLPRGCEAILRHGAMLTLSTVVLQLRLFAGMEQEMEEIDEPERFEHPSLPRKKAGRARKAPTVPADDNGKERDGRSRDKKIIEEIHEEEPEELSEEGAEEGSFEEEPVDEAFFGEGFFLEEEQSAYDDNPIYGNKRRRRR